MEYEVEPTYCSTYGRFGHAIGECDSGNKNRGRSNFANPSRHNGGVTGTSKKASDKDAMGKGKTPMASQGEWVEVKQKN